MKVVSVAFGVPGKLTLKPSSRLTKSVHCASTGVAESRTSAAARAGVTRMRASSFLVLRSSFLVLRSRRHRLAIVQCDPASRDAINEPDVHDAKRQPRNQYAH